MDPRVELLATIASRIVASQNSTAGHGIKVAKEIVKEAEAVVKKWDGQ